MSEKNVETVCTAIIKTFERPDKLISLLGSIRFYYPVLPVVIVDDSKEKIDYDWDSYTKYIPAEYDTGLGEGRNIAVRQVRTPYTLVLDDDFFFTEQTRIDVFLDILENHPFDLIGGNLIDYGKRSRIRLSRGTLHLMNDVLYFRCRSGRRKKGKYPQLDFVSNFCLARTEILLQSPWDKDLKIRDHQFFFLRLKKYGARVTFTPDVSCFHYPKENTAHYTEMRTGRFPLYHRLACQKMGVRDIVSYATLYNGPFGIFTVYSLWNGWMRTNETVPAKLSWLAWQPMRLFARNLYRLYRKITRGRAV